MKRGVVMGLMFTFYLTLSEVGTRSPKLADNTKIGTAEKMAVDLPISREDEVMTDDMPQIPDTGQETNDNYYDKSLDERYRESDTGKAGPSSSEDAAPDSSARMMPNFNYSSNTGYRLHGDQSDEDKNDADQLSIARSGGRLITDTSDDVPRTYYRHKETPANDVQFGRMNRGQRIAKIQPHDSHLINLQNDKDVQNKEESNLRDEKYENYDTVNDMTEKLSQAMNENLSQAALSSEKMSMDMGREDDKINHKLYSMDEGANRNNAKVKKVYLDSSFQDDTDDGGFDQDGLRSRDTRTAPKEQNYVIDRSNKEYSSNDKEVNRKGLPSESDAKQELKRHLHSLSPSEISGLFETITAEEKNVVEDLLKEDEEEKIHKRELHKDEKNLSIETPKLESDGAVTFQDMLEKDWLNAKTKNEKDATSTNLNNPDQLVKILSDTKYENSNIALRTDSINKEKFNPLCREGSKDNLKKFDNTANAETNNKVKLNSKRDLKTIASSDNLTIDGESPNVVKSFTFRTLQQEEDMTGTACSTPDTEGTRIPIEKINEEVEFGNATVVKRDTRNNKRAANSYYHSPRRYGELEDDQGHIRALEDSFPRLRESRSQYFDEDQSGLEPLIRVKRTSRMGKRHAGIMPEARVAYVPYRSEDDEDTDEGSEFDDDGFDDRTSNLAKRNSYYYDAAEEHPRYSRGGSYAHDLVSEFNGYDNPREADYETNQGRAPRYLFSRYKNRPIRGKNPHDPNKYTRINDNGNVDLKDERNIGSDTDNILSGVSGADENLMYSGDARLRRDRRSIRHNNKDNHKTIKRSKLTRHTNIDNIDSDLRTNRNEHFYRPNSVSSNDKIALMEKGKDSDLFGGLPLNYHQSDLNRFKRIRRTKL